MLQLPNACYCSEIAVTPQDWKKSSRSASQQWRIHYRFYDPHITDPVTGKTIPKQVTIKKMNRFSTWKEKKAATEFLIEYELDLLKNKGYNPHVGQFIMAVENPFEISTATPLTAGLNKALHRLTCEPRTKIDIANVLKFFTLSAEKLSLHNMPLNNVERKHVRAILDNCGAIKAVWTNNLFNHYRKYLCILFNELVELEAVKYNPVKDISKKKTISKVRDVLTPEQRRQVNDHLKTNYKTFHVFTHIFFHSGARISEMLALKVDKINMKQQSFRIMVKKGKVTREVVKPIKDVALPYWEQLLQQASEGDYLFSTNLEPGKKKIRLEQITRRWNMHVKKKLGITADCYSLKHTNADEEAAIIGIEKAQLHMSHTNVKTAKIYAINQVERDMDEIRQVGNSFAGQ